MFRTTPCDSPSGGDDHHAKDHSRSVVLCVFWNPLGAPIKRESLSLSPSGTLVDKAPLPRDPTGIFGCLCTMHLLQIAYLSFGFHVLQGRRSSSQCAPSLIHSFSLFLSLSRVSSLLFLSLPWCSPLGFRLETLETHNPSKEREREGTKKKHRIASWSFFLLPFSPIGRHDTSWWCNVSRVLFLFLFLSVGWIGSGPGGGGS